MFIQKAVENLLADRDIKRAAHAELRATCEQVLEEIRALNLPGDRGSPGSAGSSGSESVASSAAAAAVLPELTRPEGGRYLPVERIFVPFELACGATKSPRLVASALDSIQKLVAYGHIKYSDVKTDKPDGIPDRAFDDHVVSTVANCFQGPHTDEAVQLQVIKGLLTIVTSSHIRVHENSLLLAVRTCYNIYLASRSLINQTTAKATLNQMLNCVFSLMEAESHEEVMEARRQQEIAATAPAISVVPPEQQNGTAPVRQVGEEDGASMDDVDDTASSFDIVNPIVDALVDNLNLINPADENFKNLLQKDAFLVFRSLCKLSMKPLPEGNPDPKSHELRSKILSLQLLLGVLQNGGPAFQTNEIFVSAIKSYLCVALSQNGVSPIGEVFELSLAIFLSLLTKYRKHLKSQIEIFFKEICLNILAASSSSFEQKWLVVQGITTVCSEAQIVIDIYVNYDCDLAAANVFERLVDDLSKLAQGRQAFEKGLGVKALECLCTILKCMVEWSKDLYVNPHAPKQNALNNNDQQQQEALADSVSMVSLEQPGSMDDPSQFEKVKQHKHVLEHGLRLFAQKPAKGIKYFGEHGIVKEGRVAEFLLAENDRLDKGALGEYLGEKENKELMYVYVDLLNFSGLGFVAALRHFLEGFRLPGEAQKIDRLMEKFASRYVECNPDQNIFRSADAAYVLSYSVIMLTTDLHSTHVKKKMTKEEFIKNNRGINDDEDLPKEYLSKIYEEIASSEIKVKPTATAVGKRSLTQDMKTRNLIWSQESSNISQTAGALMESASSRKDVFMSARHLDHVKPMFKLIWSPLLANFSVGLQDCDDPAITHLCIEGFRCAIRIANIFGFSMERSAFIQALARFTLLTDSSNVSEMKSKNIEAIKTLISVANTDGNYLQTSWLDIMKSISQLEFAQMLDNSQRPPGPDPSEAESSFRNSLSEANSQSVLVAVDRIFTGSKNLSGDAIVHFVDALCHVSCDEISHSSQAPRMFSLVKLVEISYYNMERIRLEWSRIWAVLGSHFNLVGCNQSQDISFFAVDSLKQLSMKFLEKGELQNFHFQKDFLRPFEYIMKNNKSAHIRDMVVRCLSQMVQSQSSNIRSGWKNIFATFALAASDFEEPIVALSFQSAEQVVKALIAERQLFDSFQDCVKCLSEFACNQFQLDIAMEAIHLIRQCAKFVHENSSSAAGGTVATTTTSAAGADESAAVSFRGNNVWVRGWFPVLFELSCIINRSKLDIRTRSLTILFDVVKQYGHSYESSWWQDLFSVLFRLFDVVKLDQKHNSREWMDTTCNHALYAMTDVFNEFFDKLSAILLAEVFSRYKWCMHQENDQLAKSAVSCLENLVITNRNSMDEETVHAVLRFLAELIRSTASLRNSKPSSGHSIHLEVVNSVHRILFGVALKNSSTSCAVTAGANANVFFSGEKCFEDLAEIIDALLESHESAKALISSSKTSGSEMPMLVKQETHAVKCAFDLLLELYHDKSKSSRQEDVEARFLALLRSSLEYFLTITSKTQQGCKFNAFAESWSDLLSAVFTQILNFPDSKFGVAIPALYSSICDILSVQTAKRFREVLAQVMRRIGNTYGITANGVA